MCNHCSLRPLLLEAASGVRIVRHLVAGAVVEVAVEAERTVLLRICELAVVGLRLLEDLNAVYGVCSLLEVLVAQNLPQPEVALER